MKKLMIIGAGPAGISASLYAKRANLDVEIIYMEKTSLELAHKIDNYYGCPGISGTELYEIGIKQAKELDIPLHKEEVLSIEITENGYEIITNQNSYHADAVIITTGSYRNRPNINNLSGLEGKGISYCAVCDGFFYRKKRLGLIGSGNYAYHEASYLSRLTNDLIIFTNGEEIEDDELNKFTIIKEKISSVNGTDKLESLTLETGEEIERDGIFIAIGNAGSVELAYKLGILMDNNNIVVNEKQETNVPGIFAAGDCTGGLLQIAKAVYEGAVAANTAIAYLK